MIAKNDNFVAFGYFVVLDDLRFGNHGNSQHLTLPQKSKHSLQHDVPHLQLVTGVIQLRPESPSPI